MDEGSEEILITVHEHLEMKKEFQVWMNDESKYL